MRKLVAFVLMFLLIPAFAFAWTVGLTVQGPVAGMATNKITVASPAKIVSGGSVYIFPTAAQASVTATIGLMPGYKVVVTKNGVVQTGIVNGSTVTLTQATSPSQTLKAVYSLDTYTATVTQSTGGSVYINVPSLSKTSASGISGLAAGTAATVTATANNGYTFRNISSTTGSFAASATNPLSITINGNTGITANFTATAVIPSNPCFGCHSNSTPATYTALLAGTHMNENHVVQPVAPAPNVNLCYSCHTSTPHPSTGHCIGCHAVNQKATADGTNATAFVNDNNGVRAITGEFSKWSHHVTGVAVNDAHCAACHLEGKYDSTLNRIIVDTTYHMVDAKTHLRNADTDADMQWDPSAASPAHSTIDNFCMSCHDSDGATSTESQAIQAYINAKHINAVGKTASATNPFGDTISNQYDMLERPAVVDAKGQFATTNNSHHAVRGAKYTGRSRVSNGGTIADATFAANSSANLPGKRSTIFDAGKFNSAFTPLGATDVVGDNSPLHCGDCHTVGQWKAGSAMNADGTSTTAVIGAHGSNNEYMLRNTVGTDAKHTGVMFAGSIGFGATAVDANNNPTDGNPYLICFNCHAFKAYGSTYGASGSGHANEYANQDRCNGPYNTINTAYGNMVSPDRIDSVKTNASNGTLSGNTFGNVFGMQCANCHSNGTSANNLFGGIHGSKDQTYTDGMGNTSKHFRFLPGLGNTMFVPGVRGGFTGGTTATYLNYSGNYDGTAATNGATTVGQTYNALPVRNTLDGTTIKQGSYSYTTGGVSSDLNWEQRTAQAVAGITDQPSKAMGCYTLSPPGTVKVNKVDNATGTADVRLAATDSQEAALAGPNGTAEMFDNWGGCDDHNGAAGAGTSPTRKVLRKVSY